jgi:ribosome maturation factor RimP
MIEKSKIEDLVREYIKGTDIFLVAVKVNSSNRISVTVDTASGISLDQCAYLHRKIESGLDRNSEDFELQVSSPGLDADFTVIGQYKKNEGKKVEIVTIEGEKFTGILKNVTSGGFELETEIRFKGKKPEKQDISFNFDQVKSTKEFYSI